MKVQIIQLEPEDDHASSRDRLSWARGDKAVLVWPRSGRPLVRRLDLKLVQRQARRLGIELALVSFDPQVISNAKRLGIPVFDSLEQLPSGPWGPAGAAHPPYQRRNPAELSELRQARDSVGGITSLELGGRGRRAAVAAAGAALAAVAVAVLPGAEISIQPTAAERTELVELALEPGPQAEPAPGSLPATGVAAQLSGQLRMETSGRIRAPAAAATGEVEFTNLTSETLTIPAGTGLRAGEVRFLTTEALELGDEPASVPVAADQPGRQGNLAAGQIDSVEGTLGFLVQVSNPLPTSGGLDVLTRAVSEDDRQRLQSALLAQLLDQAEAALRAELGSGRALAPGTVEIGQVLEQEFDRQAGEVADELSLRMTVEARGLSFDLAQAERAILAELAESLPEGRFIVPGSLAFSPLAGPGDPDAVLFRVRASEARQIDLGAVRRTARGAAAGTIGELLKTRFRLSAPATIDLRPSWLPWMPMLEMRIGVDWVWSQG